MPARPRRPDRRSEPFRLPVVNRASVMDLESELDRLYQVPATAFVAERNALVKTLRQSGEKAAAEDVSPPPGRMGAELETMGFDALTAAAPAPPPQSRPKREPPPADPAHAEKVSTVKAALDAVAKEVRRLELETEASEARHTRAARDAEDASARAVAAGRARDEARKDADLARERLERGRADLEEARRV